MADILSSELSVYEVKLVRLISLNFKCLAYWKYSILEWNYKIQLFNMSNLSKTSLWTENVGLSRKSPGSCFLFLVLKDFHYHLNQYIVYMCMWIHTVYAVLTLIYMLECILCTHIHVPAILCISNTFIWKLSLSWREGQKLQQCFLIYQLWRMHGG